MVIIANIFKNIAGVWKNGHGARNFLWFYTVCRPEGFYSSKEALFTGLLPLFHYSLMKVFKNHLRAQQRIKLTVLMLQFILFFVRVLSKIFEWKRLEENGIFKDSRSVRDCIFNGIFQGEGFARANEEENRCSGGRRRFCSKEISNQVITHTYSSKYKLFKPNSSTKQPNWTIHWFRTIMDNNLNMANNWPFKELIIASENERITP